eukprot:CCRYP_000940-RA/>CCRYP_000940-RA protein AED:0.04 eAED:0.04 QI:20/1/1/1/1/1/2/58/286
MTAQLAALGFCGADDSVNPRLIALLAHNYPLVEWGILFRPDKEGLPRYATLDWVRRLSSILNIDGGNSRTRKVRLAAHLCGSHVNDLLTSSTRSSSAEAIDGFLAQLYQWGFRRVQVNATAVNGVYTDNLAHESTIRSFLRTVSCHRNLEFIVQKNEETEPLWSGLLGEEMQENVVFLHDESKGTGKVASGGWCEDGRFVSTSRRIVGFAGGIKPSNVQSAIQNAIEASNKSGAKEFWIDMESGVRTKLLPSEMEGKDDVFDLAKCYECIDIVCGLGLMSHPPDLR